MKCLLRRLPRQPVTFLCQYSSVKPPAQMSNPVASYGYFTDVEHPAGYEPGGYHPVAIGDNFHHHRYRIVHKLGHGAYSTIWLARDERVMKYVALKISTADCETNEANVISRLSRPANQPTKTAFTLFPSVLDQFSLDGPNGTHQCFVTEAARCSLAATKEASRTGLYPLSVARVLAAQLVLAVDQLHTQGYVHGDLHMGNMLLKLPSSIHHLSEEQLDDQFGHPDPQPVTRQDGGPLPSYTPRQVYSAIWMGIKTEDLNLQDAHLLLTDFGVAFRPEQDEKRFKSYTPVDIQPPEARFEPATPLTYASDIWSLACAMWNLVAQRPVFGEILATPDIITSQHINALGPLPQELWDEWDTRFEFFVENGSPIEGWRSPTLNGLFEMDVREPRGTTEQLGVLEADEAEAFMEMMRSMLVYRPGDRPTARQVLECAWMHKFALPE